MDIYMTWWDKFKKMTRSLGRYKAEINGFLWEIKKNITVNVIVKAISKIKVNMKFLNGDKDCMNLKM